ncbi:hypothetical protein B0I32_115318 [Nonomuraea fuscirosea]|uniref:Tyr recombinase domain-containing protein n=1 Tax=Nonomuraea fuscirosea TaxID=1291556 RepID=A0A2T0MSM3_9ACTN|nr:hypothetical protein B0I32_115318 [Nonomuraea fuscirosea]
MSGDQPCRGDRWAASVRWRGNPRRSVRQVRRGWRAAAGPVSRHRPGPASRPHARTAGGRRAGVWRRAAPPLEYVVELEELSANPLHRIKWKPAKTTDFRRPANLGEPSSGTRAADRGDLHRQTGAQLAAHAPVLLHVLHRSSPAEAMALRREDCGLPAIGCGRFLIDVSRPEVNRQWTDTGDTHEERGLKHRGRDDVRPVRIPPTLVKILRQHIEDFGLGSGGRLFQSEHGGVVASTAYTEVWQEARKLALTPSQVASPLARRPYDLANRRIADAVASLTQRVPDDLRGSFASHGYINLRKASPDQGKRGQDQ